MPDPVLAGTGAGGGVARSVRVSLPDRASTGGGACDQRPVCGMGGARVVAANNNRSTCFPSVTIEMLLQEDIDEEHTPVVKPLNMIPRNLTEPGKDHIRIPTGEALFTAHHVTTQDEARPYRCSRCERSSKNLSHSKEHGKTHRGGKAFACTQWELSFQRSPDLNRHQKIHTGEKPWSQCGKSSATSAHLKSHKRCTAA
ncbi:hypothetical protein NFI96_003279 [Prochilodus magdalenae]|nr:hypothetical protein NFI96_003279 [Prochilodus magdalenae]